MCAKGLSAFSSSCRVCQPSLGDSLSRLARGGGLCGVWPSEGPRSAPRMAAALADAEVGRPTLSDQSPRTRQNREHVSAPVV